MPCPSAQHAPPHTTHTQTQKPDDSVLPENDVENTRSSTIREDEQGSTQIQRHATRWHSSCLLRGASMQVSWVESMPTAGAPLAIASPGHLPCSYHVHAMRWIELGGGDTDQRPPLSPVWRLSHPSPVPRPRISLNKHFPAHCMRGTNPALASPSHRRVHASCSSCTPGALTVLPRLHDRPGELRVGLPVVRRRAHTITLHLPRLACGRFSARVGGCTD